jgi:hypothetical protein
VLQFEDGDGFGGVGNIVDPNDVEDDVLVVGVAAVAVAQKISGSYVELDRAFQCTTADGYPSVLKIRSLVGVGIARIVNVKFGTGFGC